MKRTTSFQTTPWYRLQWISSKARRPSTHLTSALTSHTTESDDELSPVALAVTVAAFLRQHGLDVLARALDDAGFSDMTTLAVAEHAEIVAAGVDSSTAVDLVVVRAWSA